VWFVAKPRSEAHPKRAAKLLRHLRKRSTGELSDILGDKLTYLESCVAALDAGDEDLVRCPATAIRMIRVRCDDPTH